MPKVKYVASLRTRLGVEEEEIEAKSIREAFKALSSKIPDLLDFDGKPTGLYVVLVNGVDYRLLGEDYSLSGRDNITVIPVIHGG